MARALANIGRLAICIFYGVEPRHMANQRRQHTHDLARGWGTRAAGMVRVSGARHTKDLRETMNYAELVGPGWNITIVLRTT